MKKCAVVLWLAMTLNLVGSPDPNSASSATDPALLNSLELAHRVNEAFVALAASASPAVVVINVATRPSANPVDLDPTPDGEPMSPELRKFLDEHLPQRQGNPQPPPTSSTQPIAYDSQGSGLILREDGYILTNRHVVENADQIQVRFADGREFPAEIAGTDLPSDLAVLKVPVTKLRPARWGNSSKVRVGEFAIAIGAPFDLDYTVTFGHISAKGRDNVLNDKSLDQDFLQTDAQINPGSSGGPLLNIDGEVIGINTLIRGMRTGIGFAIPANQALEIADQLICHGRYLRTWLGVSIRSLKENPALRELFPAGNEGVVIKQIEANGPARRSELKAGDLVIAVDGHPITSTGDLKKEIRSKKNGDIVSLDVLRGSRSLKVTVQAEPMPDRDHPAPPSLPSRTQEEDSGLGLSVRALTPEQSKRAGLPRDRGLMVVEVTPGGVGEAYGIKPGNIITEINRKPVGTPDQLKQSLSAANLRKGILLSFLTDGAERFEFVKSEP